MEKKCNEGITGRTLVRKPVRGQQGLVLAPIPPQRRDSPEGSSAGDGWTVTSDERSNPLKDETENPRIDGGA